MILSTTSRATVLWFVVLHKMPTELKQAHLQQGDVNKRCIRRSKKEAKSTIKALLIVTASVNICLEQDPGAPKLATVLETITTFKPPPLKSL